MRLLTNDLYEGAWLLSQGIPLEKVWHAGNPSTGSGLSGRKTVVFEFVGEKAKELLEEYRKGKALGNVVRFKEAQERMKDRMFSFIRESEILRLRKESQHAESTQEIFK